MRILDILIMPGEFYFEISINFVLVPSIFRNGHIVQKTLLVVLFIQMWEDL